MTWTSPSFSVGWLIELVILIVALLFWALGLLPKEWALAICAIAATRL